MTIRKLQKGDFEHVLSMMLVFYASDALLVHPSEEVLRKTLADALAETPYLEAFGFEENGVLTGYGMVAMSYSTEAVGLCAWIEDIYIREGCRGAGLGAAFFRFLEEKHPQRLLRLEAERENEGAVRFYGRCGFRELPYLELIK